MCRSLFLVLCFAAVLCSKAQAADFSFQGYADLRLVLPDNEKTWIDGGLGKLRYGNGQPDPNLRFAEAAGQGTLALSDDLHAVAVARVEPKDRAGIDALEAYLSYRPQMNDWMWSLKAGAFLPPFALENGDLGWTSPYTLTPSAIDTWIGNELRSIGEETEISRRTSRGTFALTGALICCNEPAGILMAYRGWTLDDRPTGIFEEVRIPAATSRLLGADDRTPLFRQIDDRVGWYAGASWSMAGIGKASLYRYDNNANDAAVRDGYHAWRTRFWSAAWESHRGALSILAQGVTGDTTIAFSSGSSVTHFTSAYLLVAYDVGSDWRIAARAETFDAHRPASSLLNEDGHAFTVALSWMPHDGLRVTGELINVVSTRGERTLDGLAPNQAQTQFQLNTRLFL